VSPGSLLVIASADVIDTVFYFLVALLVGTSKEHLGFALALGVPTFVVVSKIDACRAAQVERILHQLERTLKGPACRRVPLRVDTEDDACTAASNFHSDR